MKQFIRQYGVLIGLVIILQILAFLTSYFVTQSAVNGWYQSIQKSSLNPPDWVFAPVWTVLYTILAIVLWRLWKQRANPAAKGALTLFLMQLVLNYTWSPVFFGLGAFGAALIILLVMDGLTLACMRRAAVVDKTVTWLLVPYMAWIGFATWLTYAVMTLNS